MCAGFILAFLTRKSQFCTEQVFCNHALWTEVQLIYIKSGLFAQNFCIVSGADSMITTTTSTKYSNSLLIPFNNIFYLVLTQEFYCLCSPDLCYIKPTQSAEENTLLECNTEVYFVLKWKLLRRSSEQPFEGEVSFYKQIWERYQIRRIMEEMSRRKGNLKEKYADYRRK